MKVRIAIVGPEDSVQQILYFAEEFSRNENMELVPFSYDKTEEAEQIIQDNVGRVDQWLFSGQAPYYFALNKGLIRAEDATYLTLHGSSLLGTFLEILIHEGNNVNELSLDTIQQEEIMQIQNAHSLKRLNIYSYSYSGYEPAEDIIKFHHKLYEEGKSKVAVTCIKEVHIQLQKLGIPCYRVIPSESSVKKVLTLLKERGQSSWYRHSQIAILGIEVIHSGTSLEEHYYSYEMKHKELDLKHVLLQHAQNVQGSFVQIGDGLFFVYTTRGEVDFRFNDSTRFTLLDDVFLQSRLHIRVGIGYGLTAYDAEQNVRLALRQAREYTEPIIVSVNEKKEVHEYVKQNETEISYTERKWGRDWEQKFKEVQLSPKVISKLEAVSHRYKKNVVTANEVALWLNRTERNARRILTELEKLGLAKVDREEQVGNRGRPRKVYELLFQ
ncbi:hypothetical protein [Alkalihalobacterium chitinilyticum]|uniref:Transcriptional regulator n=1 Tax=Alkalihalobacterium chitinilyticum TaxID=2980103 RepID=A0ABT5VJF4_9BACI|nr:hypothetical protein [Alkalihalobacterium chitinilyticum]MDE5415442.1 hypothetical protein [Alkalihalobacterium chitinilyticum]